VTGVLVDTSSWINFFSRRDRKQFETVAFLLKKGAVVINGLILAELLQGFRKNEERAAVEKRLTALRILSLTHADCLKAGHLSATLRMTGETVNLIDIIIAQTAIRARLPLLHYDTDFHRIARHSHLKIHSDSL
jgi:predicted nucleic acid-binding protein